MGRAGVSDRELIVRIGLGDLESLGELFVRFQQPILNFTHRMVGEAATADTLTQEVFLRVLRHADKYDPEQSVRPWLYTIAANLCRDHLAKAKRRNALELEIEPAATTTGPFDQIASEEDCERVRQAVAELPDIYREIVVMRIYEQLPYAEIAEALNIREGTARSRMEYALNRLRKALLSPRERQAYEASKEANKNAASKSS